MRKLRYTEVIRLAHTHIASLSTSVSFNDVQSLLYKPEGFLSAAWCLYIGFPSLIGTTGNEWVCTWELWGFPPPQLIPWQGAQTEFGKKITVLFRRQSVLCLLCCTHWTGVSQSCGETAYLSKTRWLLPTKGCWALLPFTVSYLHTFRIVSGEKNERQRKAWAWFRNSLDLSVFENAKGFSSATSPGRNQRLSEVSNCDLESQFLQLNQSPVGESKLDPARASAAVDKSARGEPESAS